MMSELRYENHGLCVSGNGFLRRPVSLATAKVRPHCNLIDLF